MSNDEPSGQESDEPTNKTELRAQWEAFEFRVPALGRVRVENVSYGDESDEHVYVVSVKDGATTECTCPGDEFHCGPDEQCKHRHAVEDQPAILLAASASDEDRAATDVGANAGRAIATDGEAPMNCSECGGPVEVVDVSAGETTAFERYECVDCGGTGSYVNESGVPGGDIRTSGVVER